MEVMSGHNRQISPLKLIVLCSVVYFAGYLTRVDYAAAISEIERDMAISRQLASVAVTGSFFTYGIGQIVSGILGDRFDPRRVITVGLVMTSLINIMMFLLRNIYAMSVIWCFNGLFQALLWPPMVRICAEHMTNSEYSKGSTVISSAASAATIVVYLIVPAAISLGSWRYAFLAGGLFTLSVAAVWHIGTRTIDYQRKTAWDKNKTGRFALKKVLALGIIPAIIAIIMQGILRDGVSTWIPTYINDVFRLSTSKSILTTTVLPLFSIASLYLSDYLSGKLKNEITTASVFFIAAMVSSLAMALISSKIMIIDVLLLMLITGSMHGANLMLTARYPIRFVKYGKTAGISGLLNAFTYTGSALSSYGIAALSATAGWQITLLIWAVISAAGFLACLICNKRYLRISD